MKTVDLDTFLRPEISIIKIGPFVGRMIINSLIGRVSYEIAKIDNSGFVILAQRR